MKRLHMWQNNKSELKIFEILEFLSQVKIYNIYSIKFEYFSLYPNTGSELYQNNVL